MGSIVSAGNGYGAVVWIPLQTLYVNPGNVAAVEVDGAIDREDIMSMTKIILSHTDV